jgi:conjugal transfer pilus assembly protein TraI
MQHLATASTIAVPQMLSCLAGAALYREQNVLVDLVKRAAALVIDRDLIACATRYGRPILGAHLERYLIDAMRRLVVSHAAWARTTIARGSGYGREGLFIVWPNAVIEIRKLLEEDELPGIPKAPDTIWRSCSARACSRAGAREARSGPSSLPGKTVFEAVKLAAPEILLHGHGQTVVRSRRRSCRRPAPTASVSTPASAPLRQFRRPQTHPAAEAQPADGTITPGWTSSATTDGPEQSDQSHNTTRPKSKPGQVAGRNHPAPAPAFRLVAPLRLNPGRDALARRSTR